MFTVCPKCALTLVVTPADLRVAQGYVRCGRCSNVFNAIVGLSEDRKDGSGNAQPSTASTSIIRRAPAILDDDKTLLISDTGETESLYAEPEVDSQETRFQEAFQEKPKPKPIPAPPSPPSRSSTPPPSGRGNAQKAPVAPSPPPPAPASVPAAKNIPPARSASTPAPPSTSATSTRNVPPPRAYDDNTEIDVPDDALEFDPTATDVTQIFVDPPAAKKIDMRTGFTGTFQALKPPPPPEPIPSMPPPAPRAATPEPAKRPEPAPRPAPEPVARPTSDETQRPKPKPPAAPPAPAPAAAAPPPRTPPREGPRYPDDLVLEYDVRPVSVRFEAAKPPPAKLEAPTRPPAAKSGANGQTPSRNDATGKQPILKLDPAAKPAAPQFGVFEDVTVTGASYGGSPYEAPEEKPETGPRKTKREMRGPEQPMTAERPNAGKRGMTERGVFVDDDDSTIAPRMPRADADQVISEPPADDLASAAMTAALMPAPKARGRSAAWMSGILALGFVLVAQAIHHNRHDLATNPSFNRPLTQFYAAIGVPLVPRWDPNLFDVRQLGAFSGGGGNLTVRASLKNNATQPLPLPLLRITVQDRYGNRIATRDVEPKGYVPGAVPENAQLGAGQRLDAEMTFRDPGRDAVGFEIDACLPAPDARISCATDVVAAR